MTYLDSAIIVKLYIDEPNSEHWRRTVGSRTDLASSALAYPEVKCALRRNTLAGLIKLPNSKRIWDEFVKAVDAGIIHIFPLNTVVLDEPVRILDELPQSLALRTFDTLHLAPAKLHQCSILATTDLRMRAGATALKIPLV